MACDVPYMVGLIVYDVEKRGPGRFDIFDRSGGCRLIERFLGNYAVIAEGKCVAHVAYAVPLGYVAYDSVGLCAVQKSENGRKNTVFVDYARWEVRHARSPFGIAVEFRSCSHVHRGPVDGT